MRPITLGAWLLVACGDDRGPRPATTEAPAPLTPPGPDGDRDGDGFQPPRDCNDADPGVHPGAHDEPYDGIDADCAGGDEYDADGDGDPALAYGGGDCDDTNPDRYARAPRICGNVLDDDCDLLPDCDIRGLVHPEDVKHSEYTGDFWSEAGRNVSVGDVNGDGVTDLLSASGETEQSWLFLGPLLDTRGPDDADAVFEGGQSGAVFGDFDGDGIDDVAATVLGFNAVTNFYVGPEFGLADAAWLRDNGTGPHFTAAADLNGDGFDDLIAGDILACEDFPGGGTPSCAVVFDGPFHGHFRDDAADVILTSGDDGVPGWAFAHADLTGDGLVDLAVADYSYGDNRGAAFVVAAPLAPTVFLPDQPGQYVHADYAPENVVEVETGDLDSDGYADLAVGISGTSNWSSPGRTLVFRGPISTLLTPGEAITTVENASSWVVTFPGDLDGDGTADLVVNDQINADSSGVSSAEIYYNPRGVAVRDALLEPATDLNAVSDLASPGDIDGDGLADLIVSSAGLLVDGDAHGGAWVILGLPTGF